MATAKRCDLEERFAAYEEGFMAALARRATKVSNVLEHMLGFFKTQLTHDRSASCSTRSLPTGRGWCPCSCR